MIPAAQTGGGFSVHDIFDPYFLESLLEHWNENQFNIGAAVVDAQHLWITAIIFRMEGLLATPANNVRTVKLLSYAKELLAFLRKHLEFEQLIMKAADFEFYENRVAEHVDFLEKLQKTLVSPDDFTNAKGEALVRLMRAWLIRHIKSENSEWKSALIKKQRNVNQFATAVLKDPIIEEESAQTLLYRQLVVGHEVIPGVKKTTLDDIFLLWKRFDIRTNIPLIDIQHLWLIKMIVEIEGMLHINFDQRRAHLERTLSELISYVDVHFRSEEGLMQQLGYTEEVPHHSLHEDFKKTVFKLKFDYDAGNHHSLSNLITIMRQWLITHIVIEDAKFARYCHQDAQKSLDASRLLIRDRKITVSREQTLIFTYITARLRVA